MKLSEAVAMYKDPKERPLDNRAIKTALKKELRFKAELLLEKPWAKIIYDYDGDYEIWGHPNSGWARLTLRDNRVCVRSPRPNIIIAFLQKELLEED